MIHAVRYVIERSRSAGVGCTEPSILEIPRCEPAASKISYKRRCFVATVQHSPNTPYQHADDRRTRRVRKMQIAPLRDIRTVLQSYNFVFRFAYKHTFRANWAAKDSSCRKLSTRGSSRKISRVLHLGFACE